MRAVADRFWPKVDATGDCWEWIASVQPRGYGMFYLDGAPRLAHRVAYEMLVGPVPDGLELDHLCRNRRCVNPAHLEPVTHLVNVRRGLRGSKNRVKTHCPRGHEYAPANTQITPTGSRTCRICVKAQKLDSWRRRSGYYERRAA